MNPKFRKVTRAWVMLDQGDVSRLVVEFAESKEYAASSNNKLFVHDDGIVTPYQIDPSHTWNATRPRLDVINIKYYVAGNYERMSMGNVTVTLEYAGAILKEFNLPFRFIRIQDPSDLIYYGLEQVDRPQVGQKVETVDGPGTVIRVAPALGYVYAESFKVRSKNNMKEQYYQWPEMLKHYKGITKTQLYNMRLAESFEK